MARLLALLALVLSAGGTAAAPLDAPPATYPAIAAQGLDAEAFVPPGWRIEQRAEGDLNQDSRPDLALVLRGRDPALIVTNPGGLGEPQLDTNPRYLVILFAEASGGYRLAAANHTLIPRRIDPVIEDWLENGGVSIVNRSVQVELGLFQTTGTWESASYTFTFRWQGGRFELIGYDSERMWRNTGETTDLSVNYSTRVAEISRGNINSERRSRSRFRIPNGPRKTLEEVGDGIAYRSEAAVG